MHARLTSWIHWLSDTKITIIKRKHLPCFQSSVLKKGNYGLSLDWPMLMLICVCVCIVLVNPTFLVVYISHRQQFHYIFSFKTVKKNHTFYILLYIHVFTFIIAFKVKIFNCMFLFYCSIHK